jgi:hypothetical protein
MLSGLADNRLEQTTSSAHVFSKTKDVDEKIFEKKLFILTS